MADNALAPAPPPFVAPRVLVLGGPYSGAHGLADTLAARLGAVALSLPEVAEWVVAGESSLGREVREQLREGKALSAAACVQLLQLRLGAPDVLAKGWVLRGIEDEAMARALLEAGLAPHRVFIVSLPTAEAELQAAAAATAAAAAELAPCAHVPPLAAAEVEARRAATAQLRLVFATRGLVHELDGTRNAWALYDAAEREMQRVLALRRRHAAAAPRGGAAAVGELGLSLDEFGAGLGGFGLHCPVTWARERRLSVPTPTAADPRAALRYGAEFRGKFYSLAGAAQLASFLARPTEALAGLTLPASLPASLGDLNAAIINLTEAIANPLSSRSAELDGFCPVSLGRGGPGGDYASRMASLREGNLEHCAEYQGKLFTMADAETAAEFLATPWKYAALHLPTKLPPKATPLSVAGLPLHGFVEQTSNVALQQAIDALCEVMPKYPTLDVRSTALKFIAVYLKANNPRLRAPHLKHKYGAKLHDFTECCGMAERLLDHERRRQAASDAGTELPESTEYRELISLWDAVGERDLREFIE